eukprot:TRINITY_DN1403_c3_g1_i1.p2 TRINITY_DN1403_c3_g1~~TRINITY_DN1403_c3_g1_i1.p2  ORF type:complete len:336 (+),score=133.77 TRINITY_DN1403_c3_g1_i1:77-1084(+)
MAELPIDPAKKSDSFYRYKMPAVQVKVEGSGNGIKTVLPNISEIAQRINRDVEFPMKYFGIDMGAHSKQEAGKWIVMGQHDKERMQKCLYDYITKFVLCVHCSNPETTTVVDEQKNIWLRCGACGREGQIKSAKEQMVKLIHRKVTPTTRKGPDAEGRRGKEGKKKSKKEKDDDEDRRAFRGPDPVVVLREFLEESPSEQNIIIKVRDMRAEYGFKDKEVAKFLCATFFDGDLVKVLRRRAGVFRKLVADDCHKAVVESLERAVHAQRGLADKFPIALWVLWDEGIVEEDAVTSWFDRDPKPSKHIDPELQASLKEKTKPFIDWLGQDDDDDDDD